MNKLNLLLLITILLLTIISCTSPSTENKAVGNQLSFIDSTLHITSGNETLSVHLKSLGKYGYSLRARTSRAGKEITDFAFVLHYPVYHFELADINREGRPDILLGVIKSTHFDPVQRKRLFLYKIDNGRIRPLWMGSRISHPIVDFRYKKINDHPYIITIEKENSNGYLVAEYEWKGFGLELTKYIARNINQDKSHEIFTK